MLVTAVVNENWLRANKHEVGMQVIDGQVIGRGRAPERTSGSDDLCRAAAGDSQAIALWKFGGEPPASIALAPEGVVRGRRDRSLGEAEINEVILVRPDPGNPVSPHLPGQRILRVNQISYTNFRDRLGRAVGHQNRGISGEAVESSTGCPCNVRGIVGSLGSFSDTAKPVDYLKSLAAFPTGIMPTISMPAPKYSPFLNASFARA